MIADAVVTGALKPQGDEYAEERARCASDVAYFILRYVNIYDPELKGWIPFELWDAQRQTLAEIEIHKLLIILKARQVGLSWLVLAYILWLVLFHPIQTILIFSKRDDEAVYLLGIERLRGMYSKLPDWMRGDIEAPTDNDHTWQLANGSTVRAFPTTAGDGYTATFVLVDEADLVPNLKRTLASVQPTIDNGGQLVLLSRADKDKPGSLFKKMYKEAVAGRNEYYAIFLPWHIHPGRDEKWYQLQKEHSLNNHGSLDYVKGQYPATDMEALEANTLNKRIPPHWLQNCFVETRPIPIDDLPKDAPADIPGLYIYALPVAGRHYVASMDCAEGLPTSDFSSTDILDVETGEQVAHFDGQITPQTHAAYTDRLAQFYNCLGVMPENNNHGWAAVLWLKDNGKCRVLTGHDNKDGWSSNSKGKALMYDGVAEKARELLVIIHHPETLWQLLAIEKSTLRAPEGEHDDLADSFALAVMAMSKPRGVGFA